MCPNVLQSCCSKEDQLLIYSNWVMSHERRTIKSHYEKSIDIYSQLIKELKYVYDLALKVNTKLKFKKISNCKELSKRILSFEIVLLQDKIMENLRRMEEFMFKSFKGFYCSICNYQNHKFFNIERLEIMYSEKFCRDIVENTLPSMMFFHVDIHKYLNFVSRFLLSCDHKGDYMQDVPIPRKLIFIPDEVHAKNLKQCRDERNSQNWFTYCKATCEMFRITTFEEFFDPFIDQFSAFHLFIREQIQIISNEEA